MDSHTYFHQYRRPRNENPTFKSSNVHNSITFFNDRSSYEPTPFRQSTRRSMEGSYSGHKAPTPPPADAYRPLRDEPVRSSMGDYSRGPQNSSLSNNGQRSLQMDQRGVYQKQSSPYNILNLKPNEYNNNIRQYPRLSQENKDDVYYRRMNDQYKEKDSYSSRTRTLEKPVSGENVIAGKQTYAREGRGGVNPEASGVEERGHREGSVRKEYFTAKMLNHMDELQHNLA